MKNVLFLLFISFASLSFGQKMSKLTVNYSFKNIVDGYDHTTKLQVYCDGALVGESSPHVQSKKTSVKVSVPRGQHDIRLINMTLYNGNWEERSVANGYSTNGEYKSRLLLGKKKTITIVFDINAVDPEVNVK